MVKSSQAGVRLWKRRARGDYLVDLPLYPSLSLQSLLLAKHMWLKWNWIWFFSHLGFKFRRYIIVFSRSSWFVQI